MGIIKWFIDTCLGSLGATADIQRFSEWKNKLEEALKDLEAKYKKKKITKANYKKQKDILNEKLKKAEELLKKSRERLDKFTHKEVKL